MAPKKEEKKDHRPDGAARLGRKPQKEGEEEKEAELGYDWKAAIERMTNRVLRLFLIGFVLELKESASDSSGKSRAKKTEETRSKDYTSPSLFVAFIALVFVMRMGEEGFTLKAERPDEGVNHYSVLQVPTNAEEQEIRQSYKKLALKWHPDKNKNCTECVEKFNEIASSYEILQSPERRAAYDEGRSETAASVARASTTLNADNYITTVRASNDVWVVQLYSNSDSGSGQFHPIWEDLSQKNQRVMRFGRIDVEADAACLNLIPVKAGIPPTIFMVAPKVGLAIVVPRFSTARASNELQRFIYENVPKTHVKVLQTRDAVRDFFIPTDKVRVLLVGKVMKKMGFGLESRLAAYRWLDHASFGFVSVDTFATMVRPEQTDFLQRHGVTLPSVEGDEAEGLLIATAGDLASLKTDRTVVKKLPSLTSGITDIIEDVVVDFVDQKMPAVTQTSLELLCKSRYTRRYCLILPDASRAAEVLAELRASRAQYIQELTELRENEDVMDVEEEFWIQAVHASDNPGSLRPVDTGFFPPLASGPVVVEIETMRYAAVPKARFSELYQALAYEDLQLDSIPEAWSLFNALPNPAETVTEQVRYTLLTVWRILGLLVLLAVLVAVLPEITWDWKRVLAFAVVAVGLFLALIPASRRDAIRMAYALVASH